MVMDSRTEGPKLTGYTAETALVPLTAVLQLHATRADPTLNNPPSTPTGGGINGLSFHRRTRGIFYFRQNAHLPRGHSKVSTAFLTTFGGRVHSCKRMLKSWNHEPRIPAMPGQSDMPDFLRCGSRSAPIREMKAPPSS